MGYPVSSGTLTFLRLPVRPDRCGQARLGGEDEVVQVYEPEMPVQWDRPERPQPERGGKIITAGAAECRPRRRGEIVAIDSRECGEYRKHKPATPVLAKGRKAFVYATLGASHGLSRIMTAYLSNRSPNTWTSKIRNPKETVPPAHAP